MSQPFRVRLATDVMPAIEAWRDKFVSTVGEAKYRRAAGWALDETAKHAVLGIREQFHKHLKSNSTIASLQGTQIRFLGIRPIGFQLTDAGLLAAYGILLLTLAPTIPAAHEASEISLGSSGRLDTVIGDIQSRLLPLLIGASVGDVLTVVDDGNGGLAFALVAPVSA